jgi:RNA polymerase sigma-70 factor (ECF subfamily)
MSSNANYTLFTSLYDQYINKIFRFVYLKVDTKETAQDICSDVFTRAWKSIENNRAIDNQQAYLFKTARNLVADHYRGKTKTQRIAQEMLDQIIDLDPDLDLERKAILCSEMDNVRKAIKNISQDYQDVVIWHYLDDLTIPEIAEITGKSQGACRVALSRGLKSAGRPRQSRPSTRCMRLPRRLAQ